MTIQALTIADEIEAEIMSRVPMQGIYLGPNDFWLRKVDRDIDKLMKADAGRAWLLKSVTQWFKGDVPSIEHALNIADQLMPGSWQSHKYRLQIYANLCMASRAQEVFKSSVDISFGNLNEGLPIAMYIGAFQEAVRNIEQAKLAHLPIFDEALVQKIQAARQILSQTGTDDQICAKVIDCVGEVLQKNKLFWIETAPALTVCAETQTVSIWFKLDTTFERATDLHLELIDLLIQKDLDRLDFFVSLMGHRS